MATAYSMTSFPGGAYSVTSDDPTASSLEATRRTENEPSGYERRNTTCVGWVLHGTALAESSPPRAPASETVTAAVSVGTPPSGGPCSASGGPPFGSLQAARAATTRSIDRSWKRRRMGVPLRVARHVSRRRNSSDHAQELSYTKPTAGGGRPT